MLMVQSLYFFPAEVAQAKGFGLYIEGTSSGDDIRVAPVDAVIPDVPHTAEHHRGGSVKRTLVIAPADLAQHRNQGISHQGVYLVPIPASTSCRATWAASILA